MKVSDYDGLRQLMCVEEFKSGVSTPIKRHLDEQKIFKIEISNSAGWITYKKHEKVVSTTSRILSKGIGQITMVAKPKVNLVVMIRGHLRRLPTTSLTAVNLAKFARLRKGPVCYHCGTTGQLMSDCWFLKKDKGTQKIPVGELTLNRVMWPLKILCFCKSSRYYQTLTEVSGQYLWENFVSEGSMWRVNETGNKQILCYTTQVQHRVYSWREFCR